MQGEDRDGCRYLVDRLQDLGEILVRSPTSYLILEPSYQLLATKEFRVVSNKRNQIAANSPVGQGSLFEQRDFG